MLLCAAGCGGGYVAQTEPAAPPECQAEANNDPAVKQIVMKMSAVQYWRGNYQEDLAVAKREALLKCMRAKGLIPPGGVEPVKPVWYGPLF